MSCVLMQTDYAHSAAAASSAGAGFETNVLSRKVMPRAPAAMHHEEIDATIRSQVDRSFSCAPLSEEGEELLLGPSGWEDLQGHPYFYDPEKDEDPKRVIFPDQEKILAKVLFSITEEGIVWSVKYDSGSGLHELRYFLLCQKDHTVDELSISEGYKIVNFLSRHLYVDTSCSHDTKKLDLILRFGPKIPNCFKLGEYPRDLLNFMLYEETEGFIFIGFPSFKENPAVFHVIGKEHYTHDIVKRDGIYDFSWFGGIQNSLFVSHKDPATGIMSLSVIGALKSLVDSLSLPPSTGAVVPTGNKIHFIHQDGESRGGHVLTL